jgi:hypothetical protein
VIDALQDRKRGLKRGDAPEALAAPDVARLEALRERVQRFLSETDVPFVCYASHVLADGRVVGLGEDAERRLYVEGNALNSQATKEEILKYESFSPVVRALQEERTDVQNLWMDPEFIEEDSKTLARDSTKLFTLSALVQAYSLSLLGEADAISNPNAAMFRKVADRAEFVAMYWRRVSEVFGRTWIPTDPVHPGQLLDGDARSAYLEKQRSARNVAFQATFLLGLGRLGFLLGEAHGWNATAAPWQKLDAIGTLEFRAYRGADAGGRDVGAYDATWARTMMKPRVGRSGEVDGYVFDHSPDKIRATAQLLWSRLEKT